MLMHFDNTERFRQVCAAIMIRAIQDLFITNNYYRNDAICWFNNRRNDDFLSFIWICDLFNIDSNNTRESIFNLDKKTFRKNIKFWTEKRMARFNSKGKYISVWCIFRANQEGN